MILICVIANRLIILIIQKKVLIRRTYSRNFTPSPLCTGKSKQIFDYVEYQIYWLKRNARNMTLQQSLK